MPNTGVKFNEKELTTATSKFNDFVGKLNRELGIVSTSKEVNEVLLDGVFTISKEDIEFNKHLYEELKFLGGNDYQSPLDKSMYHIVEAVKYLNMHDKQKEEFEARENV